MVYITVCQICVFVLQLEQFRAIFIQFCIKTGYKTDNKKSAEICGKFLARATRSYQHENPTEFERLSRVTEIFLKNLD